MKVSVVIPAHNAAATIGRQLDALLRQDLRVPWEIVVADNRSTDATGAVVASYTTPDDTGMPSVRLVHADHRQGANAARNAGARASSGELMAFVDADDEVGPGWLDAIVSALASHDCAGGRSIPIGGAGFRNPFEGLRRDGGYLPYAVTANCAVRREVFTTLDGFDESFEHGGDDIEFFWRAQLAGFSLGYAPEAVVHYHLRPDRRGERRQVRAFSQAWPRLFAMFRSAGMPRSSTTRALRDWSWILARLPHGLRPGSRHWLRWQRLWLMRSGRLVGSIRHRVIYL